MDELAWRTCFPADALRRACGRAECGAELCRLAVDGRELAAAGGFRSLARLAEHIREPGAGAVRPSHHRLPASAGDGAISLAGADEPSAGATLGADHWCRDLLAGGAWGRDGDARGAA